MVRGREWRGVVAWGAVFLAGAMAWAGMPVEGEPVDTVVVPRLEAPPTIDGKLDDACWSVYPQVAQFSALHQTAEVGVKIQTSVRLGYDEKHLYLGFLCNEPRVGRLRAAITERDDPKTWTDDVVEVMLDPENDHVDYFHLMLTAGNVQFDARVMDRGWNAEWASAAYVGPAYWSAEIAIPFEALGGKAPPKGTAWGANFIRERRAGARGEATVWSPTRSNAHEPVAFGDLVFGGSDLLLRAIAVSRGALHGATAPQEAAGTVKAVFDVGDGKTIPAEAKVEKGGFSLPLPEGVDPWRDAVRLELVPAKKGEAVAYSAGYPLPSITLAEYVAHRTVDAIEIDGKLDEASWKKAAVNGPFPLWDGKKLPSGKTDVRMLWDDEYIYFAITAEDEHIISPDTERDAPLFDDDVVEIFIEEQKFKQQFRYYLEYEFSPAGVIMDLLVVRPFQAMLAWDSPGTKLGTEVRGTIGNPEDTDEGYTMEIAIPFVDIHSQIWLHPDPKKFTPKDGDILRLNIYRINKEKKEFITWSPLLSFKSGFHRPRRFGRVFLVAEPVGGKE